jgi:hypothetical protein
MRAQVVGAECTRGVCNGLTRRAERINTLKVCTRGRDVSVWKWSEQSGVVLWSDQEGVQDRP